MKYIRTKDNRIIKIPNKHQEIVYDDKIIISVDKIINGVKGQAIINGFVDKQADTIEELCDTFVIWVDKQGYLIIDDYKKAMEIMQRNDDYNAICYGAIWCEWGLKYVAKMNTKVEMELV